MLASKEKASKAQRPKILNIYFGKAYEGPNQLVLPECTSLTPFFYPWGFLSISK